MDYFTGSYRIVLSTMIILALITNLGALRLPRGYCGRRHRPHLILGAPAVRLVRRGKVC